MQIEQLDLETRSKLYGYTKKILRKYQKGIVSGKLTADKFADNILSNEDINEILDENLISGQDFKTSYISYIDTLIKIQNSNLSNSKGKRYDSAKDKPTISQKLQLRNLLNSTGYNLSIPDQYLSGVDVENITKYITTGAIDLGNEKIYNYVSKSNIH